MHLIFERPRGRFKSNCNILSLSWTPYYIDSKYRRIQVEQRQKLLAYWTPPNRRLTASESGHAGPSAQNDITQYSPSDLGRMENFGWLAIGNIGKLVGVTLTSLVPPPREIDGRHKRHEELGEHPCDKRPPEDLIVLDDKKHPINAFPPPETIRIPYIPGNPLSDFDVNGKPEVFPDLSEFDGFRPDRKCLRSNYNLRGHGDEIIIVAWNEYFQKLATVDCKGNVLIWCKINEKFTLQTPFYNRTKYVADFKWSNDGKTALICYTDSFILVGGSSGQRHWHSMLNLDDYYITCASWAPNDEQLLLGVSNGNVVVIDLPYSELTEMIVGEAHIRAMCWSSSQLNMRPDGPQRPPPPQPARPGPPATNSQATPSSQPNQGSSTIINRRRLSLNCALFCRHCPSTAEGSHNLDCTRRIDPPPQHGRATTGGGQHPAADPRRRPAPAAPAHKDILALDFANGTIKLFDGNLDDPKPREVQVNLESFLMAWSSSGDILAVAGFNIHTSAPSVGYLRCKYLNTIKFYTQRGQLIYEYKLNLTRYPITAITWAHKDQRLFVATGPHLHCAHVVTGMPSLKLLALSCLYKNTKTMDKADVLKGLLRRQLVPSVLSWQSFNCPLDLTTNNGEDGNVPCVASNETKAEQQQQLQKSDSASSASLSDGGLVMSVSSTASTPSDSAASNGPSDKQARTGEQCALVNNINVAQYDLPAKMRMAIDKMFAQTIRQPFDEQLTLNDIIWHVPKHQQRYFCTLICYTHELPDIGCVGHQYKALELSAHLKATSSCDSTSTADYNQPASDQFKIFVLYVEHEGSLIPILKARRIGFLKPEFVIFDPERAPDRYLQRHHKVSDISSDRFVRPHPAGAGTGSCQSSLSSSNNQKHQARRILVRDLPQANCDELHNPIASTSKAQSPSRSRQLLPQDYLIYLLTQRNSTNNKTGGSKHSQQASGGGGGAQHLSTSQEARMAIERYRMLTRASGGGGNGSPAANSHALAASPATLKTLPESSELVRVRSNIWGTRFKMVNVGNRMIGQRALLGSVMYRASFLHLQPRKIFLSIKDMSNYCVLCSMHHHTKLVSSRTRTGEHAHKRRRWASDIYRGGASPKRAATKTPSKAMSLIDLPIGSGSGGGGGGAGVDHLATPARTSSRRHRTHQQCRARLDKDKDKVVLPVGGYLRVAPSLEANQRYLYSRMFTGSGSQGPMLVNTREPEEANPQPVERLAMSRAARARVIARAMRSQGNNDILTLSLDQGDRVRVEMSSLNGASSDSSARNASEALRPSPTPPVAARPDRTRGRKTMNEFLQANKTLKSIQTITKMISDLSSRAQGTDELAIPGPSRARDAEPRNGGGGGDSDDSDDNSEGNQSNSMNKLKASAQGHKHGHHHRHHHSHRRNHKQSHSQQRSPSTKYVAPDTPVHKPYKLAAGSSKAAGTSQSMTNTPLKMAMTNRRALRARENQQVVTTSGAPAFDSECHRPLPPPPPPSVPFRRKISTSAKRLFDGSLRSLTGIGSAGPGGYTTSEDFDSEDCEALVGRRSRGRDRRRRQKRAPDFARYQSQPCTPMQRNSSNQAAAAGQDRTGSWFRRVSKGHNHNHSHSQRQRQSALDLSNLRARVVQKFRKTTGWLSPASGKLEIDTSNRRSRSLTRRPRWVRESRGTPLAGSSGQCGYTASTASSGSLSSWSSSSSSSSAPPPVSPTPSRSQSYHSSSYDSLDFSTSEDEIISRTPSFLNQALTQTRWFRKSAEHRSSSAKNLKELDLMSASSDGPAKSAHASRLRKPEHRGRQRRRGRRRAKKSICQHSNCCCAREIHLGNRPPIWNVRNQVYQLDFGGRVTQESAKNLQVDYDGNLALQFGRVDKCTYTLDYKYPFNAVQAMSIALASLTQRLK